MTETTPRFVLPLLVPGQGAKDVTHNEAILAIDTLMHAVVQSRTLSAPPADPQVGQAWIVGANATGDWAGREGLLGVWTDAGWRFLTVAEGTGCWCVAEGIRLRLEAGAWRTEPTFGPAPPPIAPPQGGTVVDAESRAAIALILQRMRDVGLAS